MVNSTYQSKPQFTLLKSYPEILQGISTKRFGSMLHGRAISLEKVKTFVERKNLYTKIIIMQQIHGRNIKRISNARNHEIVPNTDGIFTTEKNTILVVATADCLPIIFYDPIQKVIAAVHAGYKGILLGIIEEMIAQLKKLGSNTRDIIVGIGPGIGVCCYNVPHRRVELFTKKFTGFKNIYKKQNDKYFLDLKRVAVMILKKQGVFKKNIEILSICTSDNNDLFFSFRRDKKKEVGDFITIVGLR